jgi:hypothetical protein
MEDNSRDIADVPGNDRATGIDDPVPDSEYGDDPGDVIPDEAEEYAVDKQNGEHVDTVLADGYEDAVIQATRANPHLTVANQYTVTHMLCGNEEVVNVGGVLAGQIAENVTVEPSGEDPYGTTDTASPDPITAATMLDVAENGGEEELVEIANRYMDQVDDQWRFITLNDAGVNRDAQDSLFYVPETDEAFRDVDNAAVEIADVNQYPRERHGIVNVSFTVPYLQGRNDTHEEQLDSVKIELIDILDRGIPPEELLNIDIVDVVDIDGPLFNDDRIDLDRFFSGSETGDEQSQSSEDPEPQETPDHEVFGE